MLSDCILKGYNTDKNKTKWFCPAVESDEVAHFEAGARVVVRAEDLATHWRRPHLRAPGYVHGAIGVSGRVIYSTSSTYRLSIAPRQRIASLFVSITEGGAHLQVVERVVGVFPSPEAEAFAHASQVMNLAQHPCSRPCNSRPC